MVRLSSLSETFLDKSIIERLKSSNIFTVSDFLEKPVESLARLTNTSTKQATELRLKFLKKYGPVPIKGNDISNEIVLQGTLPSGIKKLDQLLVGGFQEGSVYELCGQSGSGKTQLCLTIASHVMSCVEQSYVHYVDAKGDFSATRMMEIITGSNQKLEPSVQLERVQITKVFDIYQLINVLHYIKENVSVLPNTSRLIIIDSVCTTFFPFIGSQETDGIELLNHIACVCKYIAVEMSAVIIITNLATKSMDACDSLKPSLGKYWNHICNTRLLVTTLQNSKISVEIEKSTKYPCGEKCVVSIENNGVTD